VIGHDVWTIKQRNLIVVSVHFVRFRHAATLSWMAVARALRCVECSWLVLRLCHLNVCRLSGLQVIPTFSSSQCLWWKYSSQEIEGKFIVVVVKVHSYFVADRMAVPCQECRMNKIASGSKLCFTLSKACSPHDTIVFVCDLLTRIIALFLRFAGRDRLSPDKLFDNSANDFGHIHDFKHVYADITNTIRVELIQRHQQQQREKMEKIKKLREQGDTTALSDDEDELTAESPAPFDNANPEQREWPGRRECLQMVLVPAFRTHQIGLFLRAW